MAVIGKIQKNSLLLLIVIGLAMLAFIFTDFLKGGPSEEERLDTAILNGEPMNEAEYQDLRDSYVNNSKSDYAYQQKEWTKAAERTAEDNAFTEMVRRTILGAEFDKLGITCTTDELNDMIHGEHIHPWILQVPLFNGANGFSRDSVRNFITGLEVEPIGGTDQDRENWMNSRKQWTDFEKNLKDARKADKYVALIKKGVFVNKLEAQDHYNAVNSKKQIKFVVQRYADIPLTDVEVNDEDIKAYYEDHKGDKEFEQEEARDIQMVYFPIVATEQDKIDTKDQLAELKEAFESTANDLGFVYQNSDSKFLSDSTSFNVGNNGRLTYSAQGGTYAKEFDDQMQEAEVGDVMGPMLSFNNETRTEEYALVKVLDVPTQKQAWVRHILISSGATRTEDRAKAIADSLVKVIKAEDNFAALVPQVSEDPGSVDNGGEYKWFAEGVMVPAFNDASFNGAIGQIQLVKTSFGYHIVEVLGQAERKTPVLAVVSKTIRPSDNTLRDIEGVAFDFIYAVSEMEGDSAFNRLALDSNMNVQSTRIFLSNDYVLGMTETDRMLGYAFSQKTTEGTISDPILDGDKYVVAICENVIEEGTPEFVDVIDVMRGPALIEKQAELYMEKMDGKQNLEEVGQVVTSGGVGSAEISFDSKSIYNGGKPEPAVIGKLFTEIPVGSMTHPIKGADGVYVFIVESELPAEETTDLSLDAVPMQVKRVGNADKRVIEALRDKADLVDNRRKIKYLYQ